MLRLKWLIATTMMVVCGLSVDQDVSAQEFTPEISNSSRFELYERQLNAILKTRRDEEKLFVKQVVKQVQAGKISTKLVNTSFQWVRNKRPGTKYPFIYFERVLRLQATKLGFKDLIPPFDYKIYSE